MAASALNIMCKLISSTGREALAIYVVSLTGGFNEVNLGVLQESLALSPQYLVNSTDRQWSCDMMALGKLLIRTRDMCLHPLVKARESGCPIDSSEREAEEQPKKNKCCITPTIFSDRLEKIQRDQPF